MSIRTLPMHTGREHRDGRLVEALRRRDADAAGASASRWTTRSRHSTLPRRPWSGVTSRAGRASKLSRPCASPSAGLHRIVTAPSSKRWYGRSQTDDRYPSSPRPGIGEGQAPRADAGGRTAERIRRNLHVDGQRAPLPPDRCVRVCAGDEGQRSGPRRAGLFAESPTRTDRPRDPCGPGRTSRAGGRARLGSRRALDVTCRERPGQGCRRRGLRQRGQDRDQNHPRPGPHR